MDDGTDSGAWSVTALGTGGWMPTDERETSCYAIRAGDAVLLLDAGTGMRRLVTDASHLRGVRRLDILVSHFHADHLIGLSYLGALPADLPVTVWAPGAPHYDAPDAVHRFLGRPYQPGPPPSVVQEVPVGVEFRVGRFRVTARWQLGHSHPSLAFRVSGALTYCTDTPADAGNVEFARGSRVLLHEAWQVDGHPDPSHSRADDAASLAVAAGVEHLVLVHANPLLDDAVVEASAQRVIPAARVACDGDRFHPWRAEVW